MIWLRECINDSKTQKASSKRVLMLVAGFAMSVSVVLLSIAALYGHGVSAELASVCIPLAGLAGYNYVNGKAVERTSQ